DYAHQLGVVPGRREQQIGQVTTLARQGIIMPSPGAAADALAQLRANYPNLDIWPWIQFTPTVVASPTASNSGIDIDIPAEALAARFLSTAAFYLARAGAIDDTTTDGSFPNFTGRLVMPNQVEPFVFIRGIRSVTVIPTQALQVIQGQIITQTGG